MTENKTKTPFIPVKKTSPFVTDPFNNRGQKGGKKGQASFGAPAKKSCQNH